MDHSEVLREIATKFSAGKIVADELLLHVEPALRLAAGDAEARRIVNAIEVALFTLNEPRRSAEIMSLLEDAIRLASSPH